jgi:hypothetical protein
MKSCASVVMIASSRRRSARTAGTAALEAALEVVLEADPELAAPPTTAFMDPPTTAFIDPSTTAFMDPPTSSAAVAAVGVGAHVPGVSACPMYPAFFAATRRGRK